MNEKREEMIGVLVRRVPLYLHPINMLEAQTMCLDEDGKKRISISHFFSCLKFCFKISKF